MKPTPLILLVLVALSARQSASKYTTLLEDEQESQGQLDEPKPAAPVSYGRLIYEQPDAELSQRPAEASGNKEATSTKSTTSSSSSTRNDTTATSQASGDNAVRGDSSVFSRIYTKISSYLPFLAQLTILRQQGASNQTASNDSELHAKTNISVSMVRDMTRQAEEELRQRTAGQDAPSNNNIGASATDESNSNSNNQVRVNDDNFNGEANQDNQQALNDDKQGLNVDAFDDEKRTSDEGESGNHDDLEPAAATNNNLLGQSGQPVNQVGLEASNEPDKFKSGGLKRDQPYLFDDSDNVDTQDVDINQMVQVPFGLGNLQNYWNQANLNEQQSQQQPIDPTTRYNMMRQSNLVMPMVPSEDMLTSTAVDAQRPVGRPSERLLGKYIYAPTQHYYLNSVMPPHMAPSQVQQHHPAKPIQPGDQIYSSYAPMKAAYSYQKEQNPLGDKPNDLYFLIMVGAFCMMATTVVLAAGLFAYRIQQNRKSSQDTGYPTYGVVGPNNISGKCGAASLVGGYFMGPPGGAGTSKSGSVRHLADLYGNVSNGTGGSDSGLNSLDKSSSNKKASSSSSLNEFHQPPSGRAASSNFMTAAASQDAARMYHYQHQKQQMIISDRNSGGRQTTASDLDSEDENDDGSYTVYECPGLAPAHEMEIKNPLFTDDQSP